MPQSSFVEPAIGPEPQRGGVPETPLRMFAAPTGRRLFRNQPQSVSGFVAALLEPGINAGVLVGTHVRMRKSSRALRWRCCCWWSH